MSIVGSIFSASGALSAFGNLIASTGDNISNLNTVGFKSAVSRFADLLPSVQGDLELGHGTRLEDVTTPFQQGAFETTSQPTDVGIQGNGYFIVNDSTGSSYYTRAGQFHLDAAGKLVNAGGLAVQGASGDITIGVNSTIPGTPTTAVDLQLNLDPSAETPATSFPSADASSASWKAGGNFSYVLPIYDSSGTAHDLTIVFRRTSSNAWEYRLLGAQRDLDPSAPTTSDLREIAAPGSLVFTPQGDVDQAASTITGLSSVTWVNGATQATTTADVNFSGTSVFGQPFTVFSAKQDGSAAGDFINFTIGADGAIEGHYTNGSSAVLGNLVLASFASPESLDRKGDTLFAANSESGAAQTGTPGANGLGTLIPDTLELSTVDLAQQFVSLISSQRAFQVNSRLITTADQMYAEAANLKT
ncbi:MAG TPA: flagellar hook protein FlgE [Candidatus Binatia bacterium]|jgi:flagellar hook protein FlgE